MIGWMFMNKGSKIIEKNMTEQDIENQLPEILVQASTEAQDGGDSCLDVEANIPVAVDNQEQPVEKVTDKTVECVKVEDKTKEPSVESSKSSVELRPKMTEESLRCRTESDNIKVLPETEVIYKLRDINKKLVDCWKGAFKNHANRVQVSHGDIFKGAPQADALVSPANSFGFMDGGIDMAYSRHFGWQMQERLQKVIHEEYSGEILVGQVAIIPAYPEGTPKKQTCIKRCNEDKPIKFLISAPTMRVPLDVNGTVNAYLAFRAVILAVQKHNSDPVNKKHQIRSVLCPGLGTAVGRMPPLRCAKQMFEAFSAYELGCKPALVQPRDLGTVWTHHTKMTEF